jgi:SnoaL-like domain
VLPTLLDETAQRRAEEVLGAPCDGIIDIWADIAAWQARLADKTLATLRATGSDVLVAPYGKLRRMDAATVRAMLEQHFSSSDPDVSHAMYHDDAVLEFPQSGERFVGVENLREWRSNYPASTAVEFREIRGGGDVWVAEISISYDQGPPNLGVSILALRGDKIARESIYVTEGWDAPEWRARWRSAP